MSIRSRSILSRLSFSLWLLRIRGKLRTLALWLFCHTSTVFCISSSFSSWIAARGGCRNPSGRRHIRQRLRRRAMKQASTNIRQVVVVVVVVVLFQIMVKLELESRAAPCLPRDFPAIRFVYDDAPSAVSRLFNVQSYLRCAYRANELMSRLNRLGRRY